MTKPTDKRGRGRPRNPALDALQTELAVSRRRASAVLKEVKSSKATTSENSIPALSPLAAARLEKIQKEIRFLETRIRTCELEQRRLEGELLYSHEAVELLTAALAPVADGLRTWPKWLAPRLHGQPIRSIEDTLTGAVNNILRLGQQNIATFKAKTSREL